MRRQDDTHLCHPQAMRTVFIMGLCIVVGLATGACAPRSRSTTTLQRCPDTVQATLTHDKPTVTVLYNEPTHDQAGHPMTALSKTTIYYDVGNGRIRAKEIPSTGPSGGGQISETITIPIPQDRQAVRANICVTATDRHGHESQ
jgi:hypothetical protein